MKESKAESARDLLPKVDKRKMKSILTEQAEYLQTSQPSWRQTKGKNYSFIPSSKKAGAALLLAASLLNPKDPLQKLWCATLVVYSTYEVRHFREAKRRSKRLLYEGHL